MNGEKLSTDDVEDTLYCDELADTVFDRDYCMDQIFNADKTNLKSLKYKLSAAIADRERLL